MTSPEVESYLRRRTGVRPADRPGAWWQQILRSRLTWLTLGSVIVFAGLLELLLRDIMMTRYDQDNNPIPGLNPDALWLAASRAWPTMLFWVVCFVLVDRYRPQRLVVWFLALGWGACGAVSGAYFINNWVGDHMAVVDPTSGVYAVRLAVFVAPFVEEGMKAMVIFFIATLDRNRFTSRASGAVIGGLAGAGFAFTENIVYYARVVVYGANTSGTGDVMGFLNHMVLLRGVLTAFGHPLFTLMTGIGVAFAVSARSKTVRVIAPAAGYLMAALLHGFFNWWASVLDEGTLIPILLIMAWPVVIVVGVRVAMSSIRQGRVVSARLIDYVTMGWLPGDYPAAFSRVRTRAWTLLMSLWHANPLKTWQLQTKVTEMALLREAITRGTVDHGGLWRERELVGAIADLSAHGGLVLGRGLRPYWPWQASQRRGVRGTPAVGWVGTRTNTVARPVLKYSGVNPQWGPPA